MPAATGIEADLVTYNKSIGAPLHRNRPYGYGLRCGVSIADRPSPHSCSERTSPHSKISNARGFVGGVPVNTETSASEIPAGALRAWSRGAAVFVLYCRGGAEFSTKALRHFIFLARPPASTVPFFHLGGHRSRAGCLSANQGMP